MLFLIFTSILWAAGTPDSLNHLLHYKDMNGITFDSKGDLVFSQNDWFQKLSLVDTMSVTSYVNKNQPQKMITTYGAGKNRMGLGFYIANILSDTSEKREDADNSQFYIGTMQGDKIENLTECRNSVPLRVGVKPKYKCASVNRKLCSDLVQRTRSGNIEGLARKVEECDSLNRTLSDVMKEDAYKNIMKESKAAFEANQNLLSKDPENTILQDKTIEFENPKEYLKGTKPPGGPNGYGLWVTKTYSALCGHLDSYTAKYSDWGVFTQTSSHVPKPSDKASQ